MLKSGVIRLGGGYTLSCVVLNVSEGGAKLQSQSVASCPERFEVQIGADAPRLCRLAWRRSDTIGVEFVAAEAAADLPPDGAGAPRTERRAWKRAPVLRLASIVFKGGFASVRCNVLDISAGGAKLQPVDPASCPRAFELRIDDGPSHKCEVVRTERGMLGVRFVDAPPAGR